MPHETGGTSSKPPPQKRARPSKPATAAVAAAPAPADGAQADRDGRKQAKTAWSVVTQVYPSVSAHFPAPPERVPNVPFLAGHAASKGALAYADSTTKQFELASAPRERQGRKLKAALGQAAGVPASTPCDQCAAGNGLWRTCRNAPALPGGEGEDAFKGACASCFYYSGTSRCSWSSRPATTAPSSSEGSRQQSKGSAEGGGNANAEGPPPRKRRRVLVSNYRTLSTSRPKDGTLAPAPAPKASSSSTCPPPQPIEPDERPPARVLGDLKPESRSHPRPRKTTTSGLREDEATPADRGNDEGWKDRRIVELEQERNEYRAALQREKEKSKKAGEEKLTLEAGRLTVEDEKKALQTEGRNLRARLKEQEASHASTIDKLQREVAALAADKSNQQEKDSETQSQIDRLVAEASSKADEVTKLREQLSSAQTAHAAQVLQSNIAKQQAEEAMSEYAARTRDLEEQLARSAASVEDARLELREAGEKHDHLTQDLARLRSAEAEALRLAGLKDTLEAQLGEAEEKLRELTYAARDHAKAEEDMKQTTRMLTKEVGAMKAQVSSSRTAEEKGLAEARDAKSENTELRAQCDTLRRSLAEATTSREGVENKLQALQVSRDQLQRKHKEQGRKLRRQENKAWAMMGEQNNALHVELEKLFQSLTEAENKLQETERKQQALQASRDQLQQEYDEQGRKMRGQEDKARAMAAVMNGVRANGETLVQSLSQARKSLEAASLMVMALRGSVALLQRERDALSQKLLEREDEARAKTAEIEEIETKREKLAIEHQATIEDVRCFFSIWMTGEPIPDTKC